MALAFSVRYLPETRDDIGCGDLASQPESDHEGELVDERLRRDEGENDIDVDFQVGIVFP